MPISLTPASVCGVRLGVAVMIKSGCINAQFVLAEYNCYRTFDIRMILAREVHRGFLQPGVVWNREMSLASS